MHGQRTTRNAGPLQRCRICGHALYPPDALPAHQGHDVLKHPTQKPMELSRRFILSRIPQGRRGRVLVPFAGSGSECVVAQALGLDFPGIEINPEYVRFACLRLREMTMDPYRLTPRML